MSKTIIFLATIGYWAVSISNVMAHGTPAINCNESLFNYKMKHQIEHKEIKFLKPSDSLEIDKLGDLKFCQEGKINRFNGVCNISMTMSVPSRTVNHDWLEKNFGDLVDNKIINNGARIKAQTITFIKPCNVIVGVLDKG